MPSHSLPNYLRTYRKRAGLSQDEVAFLLGVKSGAKACRYERYRRVPPLETALAYEAIFQAPVWELFRGTYRRVEKGVTKRAVSLSHRLLNAPPTRQSVRKLEMLQAIIDAQHP